MKIKASILFADDEDTFRNVMGKELSRMGYRVSCAANGSDAIKEIRERDFDVVVLDMTMPVMDGIEVLKRIKEIESSTEVIILTGKGSIENAVQAIKLGAYDYITKPCHLNELDALIQKAYEKRQLNRENTNLKRLIKRAQAAPVLIGESETIKDLYRTIDKVAPSDCIVLLQGESGTGKELVARIIHERSTRSDKPFVVINCATLQETLLESELFGHVKGAFTGATESRLGLFEIADGGTVFLDEIGELTPGTQAKLLRVVQSGEIRRVGENRILTVDVRIIAATHKDLAREVSRGRFREDLYFRLNVITLSLPPLRERREDIPVLIHHFLQNSCRNSQRKSMLPEAIEAMSSYAWPGNVRELENIIERLIILVEDKHISFADLPENIRSAHIAADIPGDGKITLSEVERSHIIKILNEKHGNKTAAAEALGISIKTLYNKLKAYNIEYS